MAVAAASASATHFAIREDALRLYQEWNSANLPLIFRVDSPSRRRCSHGLLLYSPLKEESRPPSCLGRRLSRFCSTGPEPSMVAPAGSSFGDRDTPSPAASVAAGEEKKEVKEEAGTGERGGANGDERA